MKDQLVFLDTHQVWQLDAATRECGRKGVANARAVLRATQARRGEVSEADQLPEAA